MHSSTCPNLTGGFGLQKRFQMRIFPCNTIPAQQNFPRMNWKCLHSVSGGKWLTEGKWMWAVASWALPPPMMKRVGPLCRSRYHRECSSIEDVMQAIRVLGVAWFNARLLFSYAGIRDCSLRCQGWLALGGWLGFSSTGMLINGR